MAIVRPFKGIRYNLEKVLLKQVVAPPYDVISPEQKETLKSRSNYNVVQLILPDGEANRYQNAAYLYNEWLEDGVLQKDPHPYFYLYEQVYEYAGKTFVRTGFVGLLRLEPLGTGSVFPHEKTLAGPKKDRFELMKACKTNFSQIFGLYMDKENRLNALFMDTKKNMPVASAVDDEGVKNTMWLIDNPELIKRIETFMRDKPIYIADGHHRYETALNYRNYMRQMNKDVESESKPYDFVMMKFVNFYDEGLKIFPTHRVVDVADDFDFDDMIAQASKQYDVSELAGEDAAKAFLTESGQGGMVAVFEDKFVGLKVLDDTLEGLHPIYRKVDTYLLQETLITGIMGVPEEKILNKDGIYFVQSLDAIRRLQGKNKAVGFMLSGVDIDVVREISEGGLVMPQKSTYFYPKLQTGLVINGL